VLGVLGCNLQSLWCAGCVRVEPAVSLVCWVCQGVTCSLVGVLGVSGCNMQSRWVCQGVTCSLVGVLGVLGCNV